MHSQAENHHTRAYIFPSIFIFGVAICTFANCTTIRECTQVLWRWFGMMRTNSFEHGKIPAAAPTRSKIRKAGEKKK